MNCPGGGMFGEYVRERICLGKCPDPADTGQTVAFLATLVRPILIIFLTASTKYSAYDLSAKLTNSFCPANNKPSQETSPGNVNSGQSCKYTRKLLILVYTRSSAVAERPRNAS